MVVTGSQRTCGSAAGGLQQDHQALQVSEDSRQPKADIRTLQAFAVDGCAAANIFQA